jgi:uncharacterized protein YyaL (SSP411 family)
VPNRLAREKSPYLLQHANNPVDWYPWGDEAFAKAKREQKPIFLSIGYSTCHWCHVMEHESFEDEAVAERLNRDFVPIKVDREERPDVDRIYMASMQAMGMGGGWPLNAFLTPDLEPFFGGTYFPPRAIPGRPGMIEVLERVHEVWGTQREALSETGRRVLEAIAATTPPDETAPAREELFDRCAAMLARAYDAEHGGFGHAPKFPSVVNLAFLMRWWARDREGHAVALEMVRRQLDAMRDGGIHDHLGGGFHRYSTDAEWLVPHFEKMLYDQAQLAWAYLEAFQATGDPLDAGPARGIFGYVARDLASPAGAFYSAEDADSEGEEGRFYVWTPGQLRAVLEGSDARIVMDACGVTERGNFEHGASILHRVRTFEAAAAAIGIGPEEARERHRRAHDALVAARAKRPRPHRDEKILTAWNGLMISAFARGARVLKGGEGEVARRAAEFAWSHLRARDGGLLRRWSDGEAAGAGQLDDYACLALGFIDLHQAIHEPVWLERAVALAGEMVARFRDPREGGFFESPEGDPSIKVRLKDGFDGAEIAGNSIAHLVLVMLGRLLDRREWLDEAERGFEYYSRRLATYPAAMPMMLVAMELAASPTRHIVIAAPSGAADERFTGEIDRRFLPHDPVLVVDDRRREALAKLVPFVSALKPIDGKTTAYVCENYACRLPVMEPEAFAAQLDDLMTSRGTG